MKSTLIVFACVAVLSASQDLFSAPGRVQDDGQTALLEKLKTGVCLVQRYTRTALVGHGSGFFVGASGDIVTNFHVIEGGSEFTVQFEGSDDEHDVEIWSIVPERDLAILRLANNKAINSGHHAFAIPNQSSVVGATVFAMGYPKYGFTTTSGMITAHRVANALSSDAPIYSQFAPDCKFVQTDCTINSGNSGGPLFDVRGRLVGVATIRHFDNDNQYMAVDAREILHALDRVGPKPIPVKDLPLPVATSRPLDVYGLPTVKPRRIVRGMTLRASAKRLGFNARCRGCQGDGERTEQRSTSGKPGSAGALWYVSATCTVCGGHGYNPPKKMLPVLKKAITDLASLDESSPRARDAMEELGDIATQIYANNPRVLARLINPFANDTLSSTFTNPGEPTAFVGKLEMAVPTRRSIDEQIYWVSVENGMSPVILVEPKFVEGVEGEGIFAGGIYAGSVAILDEDDVPQRVPVIRHGFMVNR